MLEHADDAVAALLADIRNQSIAAIEEIRRLIYDLRPPELDDLGLVEALRHRADQLSHRPGPTLRITVQAPAVLPPLPAGVEVAAYRIGVEALTNAARHANATAVSLHIGIDDTLTIEVRDNGGQMAQDWVAGTGLRSIQERATELGGTCTARPDVSGGWVTVHLPLGATSRLTPVRAPDTSAEGPPA
jgi:two-component system NarL family sensor kinase